MKKYMMYVALAFVGFPCVEARQYTDEDARRDKTEKYGALDKLVSFIGRAVGASAGIATAFAMGTVIGDEKTDVLLKGLSLLFGYCGYTAIDKNLSGNKYVNASFAGAISLAGYLFAVARAENIAAIATK